LQKSIDLLDASDEIDAILVVLSLSSDIRMPFKQAELKRDRRAAQADRVLFVHAAVELRAHRAGGIGGRRASGLTHAGVALRRITDYAKFKLAPPVDTSAPALRDVSSHLRSATLSEHDSKSLLREAGVSLPDEIWWSKKARWMARLHRSAFRW